MDIVKEFAESPFFRLEGDPTRENILLVQGNVLVEVKGEQTQYPTLWVFPHAYPYRLPSVYLLKEPIKKWDMQQWAKLEPQAVAIALQAYIRWFPKTRHQLRSGALCLLEEGFLEAGGPALFTPPDLIERVMDWLYAVQTGRTFHEGAEVDLMAYMPKVAKDCRILVPDVFEGQEAGTRGEFFSVKQLSHLANSGTYTGWFLTPPATGLMATLPQVNTLMVPGDLPMQSGDLVDVNAHKERLAWVQEEYILHGLWWQVQERPEIPITSWGEIAALLTQNAAGYSATEVFDACLPYVRRGLPLYFGLRFLNDRKVKQTAFEWVFFRLVKPPQKEVLLGDDEATFWENLAQYELEGIYSERISEAYFHMRYEGRAERTILKTRQITLLGIGSLGGEVADGLAKAGIGRLDLIDADRYHWHNAVRHVLPSYYQGLPKVWAMQDALAYTNPFVAVHGHPLNVYQPEFLAQMQQTQLGLSCIADDTVEGYVNEVAVAQGKPMYYARLLRGGKAARIMRVFPGQDACLHCLMLHFAEEDYAYLRIPEDPNLPELTNECNNPVRPASASDVKLAASLVTRLVLDALQQGESEANHWVWTSETLSDWLTPWALTEAKLPPHPLCPCCQRPPQVQVQLTAEVKKAMQVEIARQPQLETGGVLLGSYYPAENRMVIRYATEPGPKAQHSPTGFLKDARYTEAEIVHHMRQHGKDALYLGEWHYHPFPSHSPSAVDISTMAELTEQAEYPIDQPLMLIWDSHGEYGVTAHLAGNVYYEPEIEEV